VTSFGLVRPWAPFLFILVLLSIFPSTAHSQQIAVAPFALGFGNVFVGSSETQSLSITNTGSASGLRNQEAAASNLPPHAGSTAALEVVL